MTDDQIKAVTDAVRAALTGMGLDGIRSGEFFGMNQGKKR